MTKFTAINVFIQITVYTIIHWHFLCSTLKHRLIYIKMFHPFLKINFLLFTGKSKLINKTWQKSLTNWIQVWWQFSWDISIFKLFFIRVFIIDIFIWIYCDQNLANHTLKLRTINNFLYSCIWVYIRTLTYISSALYVLLIRFTKS